MVRSLGGASPLDTGSEDNSTYSTDSHHASSLYVLYFLFTSLTVGAFTLYVQKRVLTFFPYHSMIFVIGMILGVINIATKGGLGDLSKSIDIWVTFEAHLLSAVFLPALIFSDAMQVDFHLFKRIFYQAALMATGGVALQTICLASFMKYALVANGIIWDWYICFMFGAVLAATDPVSVVVMLETVQAPAKLQTLMSGESHLSDLLALVTFNIFLTLSTTGGYDTNKLISYVFSMLFGGPLLGILFGMVALIIIRANTAKESHEDVMIQVTVTLILAYFSFIVSENNLSGNGVLATVTAALIIAAFAWPSFADPSTVRHVWKAIEFFGTTIIFQLAGLVLGTIMYKESDTYLYPELYGCAILIWLMVYAIRTAIVFVFFPILSRMGYGLRLNEGVVMTWGGLKGAVAVALGLIVFNSGGSLKNSSNPIEDPNRDAIQFFFLVGAVVFLSVLINSSTTPFLMRVLRVLSKSGVQKLLLKGIETRVRQRGMQAYQRIVANHEDYKDVKAEEFRGVLKAFDPVSVEDKPLNCWGKFLVRMRMKPHPDLQARTVVIDNQTCNIELLEVVRELFLDIVKAAYWDMIEGGTLPRNAAATRTLLQSVDIAKDEVQDPLNDYSLLSLAETEKDDSNSCHERFFRFIDEFLPDWVTIDDYFGAKLHAAIREDSVFMASSFISAHKAAQKRIAAYVGEGDDADTPEEKVVIAESQKQIDRAEQFMEISKGRDNHIVHLVAAKKVGSHILTEQDNLIKNLQQQGVLDEHTAGDLHSDIEKQFQALRKMDPENHNKRNTVAIVTPERPPEDV